MPTRLTTMSVQVPLAVVALVVLVAVMVASLTAVTEGDLKTVPTPTPSGNSRAVPTENPALTADEGIGVDPNRSVRHKADPRH